MRAIVTRSERHATVGKAAQAARRFLLTQDLDFSDARKYTPGTHRGLLVVRLPQPGRTALRQRIMALFQSEEVESSAGCIVTATSRKVRIKKPIRR